MKQISLILILCLVLNACSSDNTSQEFGDLEINFTNLVGGNNLELNTETYAKNGDETYSVSELKYIISNIVLTDNNGNQFVYPQAESYFLINEAIPQSQSIKLENINANTYTSITFGFGVDQSKYPLNGVDNFVPTAEEQGMLWSWSAGYKFLKFEGIYTSGNVTDKPFLYHIGSHGQNLDNYREITLNFLQPLALSSSETPEVNINFDVQKIFNADFALLLSDKDDIQIDPENAPKIVDNITKAFEIVLN
ncbi:hypothetical protein EIG84_01110 [Flavobacteriaceae bacterium 14752]|nr:hypothetical protein EIG84_01110 [Flavobacteriaceae bacterium 14752]